MTRITPLAVAGLCAALAACAGSPTRGSWSCRTEGAGVCATIDQIDHSLSSPIRGAVPAAAPLEGQPIIDGASPARWWQASNSVGAPTIGAPVRQGDQVMRVVMAPWIDSMGDYHGASEVWAVMRKGGWWVQPPTTGPARAPALQPALQQPAPSAQPLRKPAVATAPKGVAAPSTVETAALSPAAPAAASPKE